MSNVSKWIEKSSATGCKVCRSKDVEAINEDLGEFLRLRRDGELGRLTFTAFCRYVNEEYNASYDYRTIKSHAGRCCGLDLS